MADATTTLDATTAPDGGDGAIQGPDGSDATLANVESGATPDATTADVTEAGPSDAAEEGETGNTDTAGDAGDAGDGGLPGCPATGCGPWQSVSIGSYVGCGIGEGGVPYCWGDNTGDTFGSLEPWDFPPYIPSANGTRSSLLPVQIAPANALSQLTVNGAHVCALDVNAIGTCWGDDQRYDLVAAPLNLPLAMIRAGWDMACAIDQQGKTYCWGLNTYGALGIGSLPPDGGTGGSAIEFGQVLGGPYKTISPSQDFACALDMTGAAFCWGNDASGQVGNGPPPSPDPSQNRRQYYSSPTAVSGGISFATISTGPFNACGVATDGRGFCWGDNTDGLLGTVQAGNQNVPTQVQMPSGVLLADIEAGGSGGCGLTTTGAVYCWGSNLHGALGQGTADDDANAAHPTPLLVPGLPAIASISHGQDATCAISTTGARYCWGLNNSYVSDLGSVLGDGTQIDRLSPELVP